MADASNQPSTTLTSVTAEQLAESLLPPGKALFSTAAMVRLFGVETECWKRWRRKKTKGSPSYIRVGRAIRYPRAEVIRWLAANVTLIPR